MNFLEILVYQVHVFFVQSNVDHSKQFDFFIGFLILFIILVDVLLELCIEVALNDVFVVLFKGGGRNNQHYYFPHHFLIVLEPFISVGLVKLF